MEAVRKSPMVSVCVITYNQASYIRACLQSIVDQETDFDFEVIVGDDCSTDGTREVVAEFASRYPGKVVPLLYPEKVGGTQNFISVHNRASGTYVAHIDGDDIALPGKLQKQVDYLNVHPDCSVVWHRVIVFDDAGTLSKPNLPNVSMFEDGIVHLSDVLKFGSVGYHSSMMYRAKARKTREVKGETLDYFYTVEMLLSGYGKYLEDILGKYRNNRATGISRTGRGPQRVMQQYAEHLNHYLLLLPMFRREIFINSLLYLLVEIKNRRVSAYYFLKLVIGSFSFVGYREFIDNLRRFRRINVGM